MNETELYLLRKKSALPHLLTSGFLLRLIGLLLAFGVSFLIYQILEPAAYFRPVSPLIRGDLISLLLSLITGQLPSLLLLAILFTSVFFIGGRTLGYILCSWKGATLGCLCSLILSGRLSHTVFYAVLFYFLSAVILVLLSAYAAIYSDCILKTHAAGEYRLASALSREYILCFLTLSGGVILTGMLSSLFV